MALWLKTALPKWRSAVSSMEQQLSSRCSPPWLPSSQMNRTYIYCLRCFSSNSYSKPAPGTARCLWSYWCQGLKMWTHRNLKKVIEEYHELFFFFYSFTVVTIISWLLYLMLYSWSIVEIWEMWTKMNKKCFSYSALMLHTLVSEGLISEYKFVFIPETTSDLQGSSQVLCSTRTKVF